MWRLRGAIFFSAYEIVGFCTPTVSWAKPRGTNAVRYKCNSRQKTGFVLTSVVDSKNVGNDQSAIKLWKRCKNDITFIFRLKLKVSLAPILHFCPENKIVSV